MTPRILWICCVWSILTLMIPSAVLSIEPLTNNAMGSITGQATVQPSNEKRETVYSISTETTTPDDTLQVELPDQSMTPSTLDSDHYNAVLIDFLGVEANEKLGIQAEDFHGEAEVGNIVYTDEDTLTSVVLSGTFTGFFKVPSIFKDGRIEHEIQVSPSNIPQQVIDSYNNGNGSHDFILSHQGTAYTPGDISEVTPSIIAKPNRQAQLVGRAVNKPLNILVPRGHGDNTTWNVITTIAPGKSFVHIDINRLTTHHNLKYTIKIANNESGLNAGDTGSRATDRSGTLGTLYMGGDGKTTVEPGSIVITTFDDGV
ncbi:hypothetical protein [Desulfoluna spongiiphila]|uniref:hypothetical protein n=1 Tax=Desulfoluna spongiiphila TaxID=419481 RepID=UPI001256E4E6|nr:hypothetical protein [Desulfoluna spongiiphila]VVS95211.1 hypothetical protein DBB_47880 [Desulfoluna spongiiphila]